MNDAVRNTWFPHVTVAAVVCVDDRFLVVEEEVGGCRLINQPAGHLEPGESLVQAAARETYEETGYRVQPEALIGIYQWTSPSGEFFLRSAFAASVLEYHCSAPLDDGIIQALWMTEAELTARQDRLRSPMVLQNIRDYRSGQRLPLDTLHYLDSPCPATTS